MPTATQRTRVRNDLSLPSSLADAEIDDWYTRAEADYSASSAIEAQVRVIGVTQLLAGAARLRDYTQNESSEKASQVFDHLRRLREFWKGELAEAIAGANPAARWGGLRRKPSRIEEMPDA